jgi:hypothetical protein
MKKRVGLLAFILVVLAAISVYIFAIPELSQGKLVYFIKQSYFPDKAQPKVSSQVVESNDPVKGEIVK